MGPDNLKQVVRILSLSHKFSLDDYRDWGHMPI